MKIAVYTIAKNEEQFVEKWYQSAKDADYLLIADTGSTDKTREVAKSLGINVARIKVDPWRFDVARNLSLDALPDDIDVCIAVDMDEILTNNWREEVEKAWLDGVTRLRYKYVWSWNHDGSPAMSFGADKIHSRHGYRWAYPVHEVLVTADGYIETKNWCGLEIHHYPDPTKPRSQYFDLLKLAVEENPDDARNAHYLAREYFIYGMKEEAEAEFKRHLSLKTATWAPERAESMRYLFKITDDETWLKRATVEYPEGREAYTELAKFYYERGEWESCLKNCLAGLRIKHPNFEYFTEGEAWGPMLHDLAAIAAYNLGFYYEALGHGKKAVEINMGRDQRLLNNLSEYSKAIQS